MEPITYIIIRLIICCMFACRNYILFWKSLLTTSCRSTSSELLHDFFFLIPGVCLFLILMCCMIFFLRNFSTTLSQVKPSTQTTHDSLTSSETSKNTTTVGFPQFTRLPAEIQVMVWGHVFAERTVFSATTYYKSAQEKYSGEKPHCSTRFVGAAPFLASQACFEARRVMRATKSYFPISKSKSYPFLFNLDKTVFFLGHCTKVYHTLQQLLRTKRPHLPAGQLHMRHIVVFFSRTEYEYRGRIMAPVWPAFTSLKTVMFVYVRRNWSCSITPPLIPSPSGAAFFLKVAQNPERWENPKYRRDQTWSDELGPSLQPPLEVKLIMLFQCLHLGGEKE
jgi:hypothetical protein